MEDAAAVQMRKYTGGFNIKIKSPVLLIKTDQTGFGTQPYRSFSIFEDGVDLIVLGGIAVIVTALETDEGFPIAVKTAQTIAGSNPKDPAFIQMQTIDSILNVNLRGIFRVQVTRKNTAPVGKLVQTIISTDPEQAVPGRQDHANGIVAQAARIVWPGAETCELFPDGVKMIDAAADGSNPKSAIVVHDHIVDHVMTQTVAAAEAVVVNFKIVSVIAVQPAITAEPHETVPVLKNAGDRILGQAVFNGDVLETGTAGIGPKIQKKSHNQQQPQTFSAQVPAALYHPQKPVLLKLFHPYTHSSNFYFFFSWQHC
ncbi:MAG: hypothetical protein MUP71_01840 [Candidatus Aminicenantes bacterium]|nr:hypothetical protein [Candidatus Aminicenantes bacterium]